jgi:glutamyl/glutaminyl-tRNA synthetase
MGDEIKDKNVIFVDGTLTQIFVESDAKSILLEIKAGLAGMEKFEKEAVEKLLRSIAEKRKLKLGQVAQPLRVALTGSDQSPPIHDVLSILLAVHGRELIFSRIDKAIVLCETVIALAIELTHGGKTSTILLPAEDKP